MLSVVMLSVVMLSVVMLNVVMLIVVMKKKNTLDIVHYNCLLFQFHNRKSMFAIVHSDINSQSLASFN